MLCLHWLSPWKPSVLCNVIEFINTHIIYREGGVRGNPVESAGAASGVIHVPNALCWEGATRCTLGVLRAVATVQCDPTMNVLDGVSWEKVEEKLGNNRQKVGIQGKS